MAKFIILILPFVLLFSLNSINNNMSCSLYNQVVETQNKNWEVKDSKCVNSKTTQSLTIDQVKESIQKAKPFENTNTSSENQDPTLMFSFLMISMFSIFAKFSWIFLPIFGVIMLKSMMGFMRDSFNPYPSEISQNFEKEKESMKKKEPEKNEMEKKDEKEKFNQIKNRLKDAKKVKEIYL